MLQGIRLHLVNKPGLLYHYSWMHISIRIG